MKSLTLAAILAISAGIASATTLTLTNNDPHSTWIVQPNYNHDHLTPTVNGVPQPIEYYPVNYGESITVTGENIIFFQEGNSHLYSFYDSPSTEIFINVLKPNKYDTSYTDNVYMEIYDNGMKVQG